VRSYLIFVLWTDLRRRSALALALSTVVIAASIGLCGVLFAAAAAVSDAVEQEIANSGATDSMEIAARPDKEYRKPWAAAPIGTEIPDTALDRLVALLREALPRDAIRHVEPAWLSPGWVYLYLTPPEAGGAAVAVGISLSSPADPEQTRLGRWRMAGGWLSDDPTPQLVLPERVADRLWQDVLFVGEPAWVGITETSTCIRATVSGIYRQTQRNYGYANRPVVDSIRQALAAAAGKDDGTTTPGFDRVRMHFANRSGLVEARRLAEERYKFWVATPYDRFEGRIQLVTALRVSAWAVFGITAAAAFGTVCCTFLAWVSRRRYEIALLKAQGAGNGWVAGIYLIQSGAAGLAAGTLGIGLSGFVCPRLARWLATHLEWSAAPALALPVWVALALIAASTALAVAAAGPPAVLAARADPWAILREAG
jgi:cell division protein FtsX